ncbi:helix-turn-helix domain-containing protein [Clostridium manihotivorum]|uniref:AraC family transcriptional regulator n=1 Tax=Clostridium manihotivorum TaxID=2320868 RepID=A0A3R5V859_9CLOT|nr:helix-turn-helix domain-containing protein [Clostridium manihotivorum]QAA32351.1 AraC family transcriptional regulator [Clostridium manihotivorum]
MFKLSDIYYPITATPFNRNETYVEIEPCQALKPYIRCFWGTPKPYTENPSLKLESSIVIPDTCMDIIFDIDISKNQLMDIFCGINDTSFITEKQESSATIACFAIRFYCWAVPLFSDEAMNKALNAFTETEVYFKNLKNALEHILLASTSIVDRVGKVQDYLLMRLNINKQNNNLMNAVYKILQSKGTASISEILNFTTISQRQLERLFLEYVGVSPKKLSGLIRYQYLWQDIIRGNSISIQDLVSKYAYVDQAHLLRDFKKYHTMTPRAARAFTFKKR